VRIGAIKKQSYDNITKGKKYKNPCKINGFIKYNKSQESFSENSSKR
jgi:hypothetical protein